MYSSSCSLLEHLIPAVNLQQSCELSPPRFPWEAQGQLIMRPKTLILPSIPWHMWFRMRQCLRTKSLQYILSSWIQLELCLGHGSPECLLKLNKWKPPNRQSPAFSFASVRETLYKINPWSSDTDNGWRLSQYLGNNVEATVISARSSRGRWSSLICVISQGLSFYLEASWFKILAKPSHFLWIYYRFICCWSYNWYHLFYCVLDTGHCSNCLKTALWMGCKLCPSFFFCFVLFLVALSGMWYFTSPTRDPTCTPCSGNVES